MKQMGAQGYVVGEDYRESARKAVARVLKGFIPRDLPAVDEKEESCQMDDDKHETRKRDTP